MAARTHSPVLALATWLPLGLSLGLLSLGLPACGSGEPFCSAVVDATGRAVAACENPRQDPVCDLPGEEAHFEERATGYMLAGGAWASCNGDEVVVCPLGTVGAPYCITDPEL